MAKDKEGKKKRENNFGGSNGGIHVSGKEVEARLLEAGSEEELETIRRTLILEGIPEGTVKGRVSGLRAKGGLIFSAAVSETVGTKPLPIEGILRGMKLPQIGDGKTEVFNAGVEYGMKSVIAGVRLAQELSQMGVAQASPLIRMSQEMRAASEKSAEEAGRAAAEEMFGDVAGWLNANQPKAGVADIATVANPMTGIFARALEPVMTQMLGKAFGAFGKQRGQIAQTDSQTQPEAGLPPGWTIAKKDKKEKGLEE